MVPCRFRIHITAFCVVLSCFILVNTGCQPPREQAITTEDGEVATDFSADMIDDGTPAGAEPVPTDGE